LGGAKSLNAVWTYEEPYTAVEAIRGYLAFYRDRIDSMESTSVSRRWAAGALAGSLADDVPVLHET
jgi:hypothetical protein